MAGYDFSHQLQFQETIKTITSTLLYDLKIWHDIWTVAIQWDCT